MLGMDPLMGISAVTDQVREFTLETPTVIGTLVLAALLGLWLLQMGLSSPRPRAYEVLSPDDTRQAKVDRHGLEQRLANRVRSETPVTDCRVRIRRWEAKAYVDVRPSDDADEVKTAVYTVIDKEQEALGMKRALTARVIVSAPQLAAPGRVQ